MKIVIVGGGTAGWLTALYAKKMYPEHDVTLIESEKIGILGAGEGAAIPLFLAMKFLEISFVDLVKECNISIKNGIRFTNWSSKKDSYFHPFASTHPASNDFNFSIYPNIEADISFSHIYASRFDHNLKDYSFMQKVSFLNKIPLLEKENISVDDLNYPASDISIHFDAKLLAEYLQKIGISRGIVRKEGLVNNIIADENGYIKKIWVGDQDFDVDFIFDCTGFKRLIIGNFYSSKWISHENNLPANRALPFFIPAEKDFIPPYTESIAMDYGWMWKIPLQHRFGCGYVFDDNMISEEKAKKELDEFLGFEVDVNKSFSFNAGVYEKIWIKNCLAIGLSSGFIEPLEATSLSQSISAIYSFFTNYGNIKIKDEKVKSYFNKRYLQETKEVVDFLYLHYVTDKKNTDFWKNFTKNNQMPDFIDYVLSVIKERPLEARIDFFGRIGAFHPMSYNYVLVGNNILTKKNVKKHLSLMRTDKTQDYLSILEIQDRYVNSFIDHKKFLDILREES